MPTTASDKPSDSAEEALKRQKKQARREAKLMLAIEEAKRDLTKAQKQQLKAQARVEKRSTALHNLEARLEELHAPGPEYVVETSLPIAEQEQQLSQTELESSITSDKEEQSVSDQEYQGTIASLTGQILASPQVEDVESTPEATSPEATVVTQNATGGEAMQEYKAPVERAPAATTPRKRSTPRTATARATPATKQPAQRSPRSRKPSSDTGQGSG